MNATATSECLARLVARLRERGVEVRLLREDEPERVTVAQLRTRQIIVNPTARDALGSIFTIAHLFGHLVQFADYDRYRHFTERIEGSKPTVLDEAFKVAFYSYEREAFGFGKTLLLEAFPQTPEMESKYAIFMETDFAHFWYYLTTGDEGDITAFLRQLKQNYEGWRGNRTKIAPRVLPANLELDRPVVINVQ